MFRESSVVVIRYVFELELQRDSLWDIDVGMPYQVIELYTSAYRADRIRPEQMIISPRIILIPISIQWACRGDSSDTSLHDSTDPRLYSIMRLVDMLLGSSAYTHMRRCISY